SILAVLFSPVVLVLFLSHYTPTPALYTLSLHDALPILPGYNFTFSNPARFNATIFGQAEMPEPHDTMISSALSNVLKWDVNAAFDFHAPSSSKTSFQK